MDAHGEWPRNSLQAALDYAADGSCSHVYVCHMLSKGGVSACVRVLLGTWYTCGTLYLDGSPISEHCSLKGAP